MIRSAKKKYRAQPCFRLRSIFSRFCRIIHDRRIFAESFMIDAFQEQICEMGIELSSAAFHEDGAGFFF